MTHAKYLAVACLAVFLPISALMAKPSSAVQESIDQIVQDVVVSAPDRARREVERVAEVDPVQSNVSRKDAREDRRKKDRSKETRGKSDKPHAKGAGPGRAGPARRRRASWPS